MQHCLLFPHLVISEVIKTPMRIYDFILFLALSTGPVWNYGIFRIDVRVHNSNIKNFSFLRRRAFEAIFNGNYM